MRDRDSTRPFVFFFLVLPYGVSSGFVSITLPFVLTRVGFSVHWQRRSWPCVGKSLAISLGTGGGPDFDRAPLVFVGTWHVRGDAVASCLSIAPSKRRRDFDGSCFCFASCGNIDRSSGRWVDGAYGRPREQKVARLAGIRREISAAMASAFGLPVISPRRSPAADSRSPCSRRRDLFCIRRARRCE